jgi:hypothetical protein
MHAKQVEGIRQGEHHMKIRNGQKFLLSCLYPLFSLVALALRTMTVAATIVADAQVAAGSAAIHMGAKSRTATSPNGVQCTQLPGIELCPAHAGLHIMPVCIQHTGHLVLGLHQLCLYKVSKGLNTV